MQVLIAYASRHGATQGIAERIAETLRTSGLDADVRPAESIGSVAGYDAFVIGSAAYMWHWQKAATALVRRERSVLVERPVWLFSSGPLGTDPVDAKGRDQKEAAIPKEIPELVDAVHAREHRVFFGALEADRKPIGIAEHVMTLIPATTHGLPVGDFRDWPEIDAWATEIARELAPVPVG
jgi:menaquinone-dependent protoporphyrinogen oxidase